MIPRGQLDIEWSTLAGAVARGSSSQTAATLASQIEQLWPGDRPGLPCLSVRSGFDALLTAHNWPAGTEILVSAVNIPDMGRLIHEHGLVPVPVDVLPQTLGPDLAQLRARITPHTRALLVAHLFGCRLDLSRVSAVAREHGLELWEDVAQGFAADGWPGDELADVSCFSFGLIKTQTTLNGGYLRFRDADLARRCREVQSHWPVQSLRSFRRRIRKALQLRSLSRPLVFTCLSALARLFRVDFDDWLSRSVRGFRPDEFFRQLRQQPCVDLLDLLLRRLQHPDRRWLTARTAMAESLRAKLPSQVLLGTETPFPVHWVLPIRSRDPQQLRSLLLRQGFDATTRGSQLRVVPPTEQYPEWTTPEAERWVSQLLYLPLHPALTPRHQETLARLVSQFEAG